MKTMADFMDEYDAERLAHIDADEARRNTPEYQAKIEEKREKEHLAGVRNGWWDEGGEPIQQSCDDEDDDQDDE